MSGGPYELDQVAMMMVQTAFRFSDREMTDVDRLMLGLRVKDAIREGMVDPGEIAFRALDKEGHAPRWVTAGAIRYIGIGPVTPGDKSGDGDGVEV